MIIIARKSKCKGENCNKELLPEEKQIYKGKSYCTECYLIVTKDKENDKVKDTYKELINYICDVYGNKKPSALIFTKIKQCKNEFDYPYSAMQYTLWYMHEILMKNFNDEKHAVDSIKFYYDDAKHYFEQQEKIRKSMKNHKPEENVRIVNIHIEKSKYNKKFTLNLDDLIGGDK